MTRFTETSAAALILLAASVTFPAAQVSGGSGSSGGSSSGSAGSSSSTSGGAVSAPAVSAPSSAPAASVPSPATDPNNQVAPSAVGLPGGGDSVPQTPGSGIGSHVPVYGTQDASGIGNSINKSEQRSSSTDCTGTGTKSSTGSGSTSTTTSSCASGSGGLGTNSIMGGSGSIDVNR